MPRETRLAQIAEDLTEYNRLMQQAQRQRVKDILSKQIKALTAEQTKIQKEIELQTRKAEQKKLQQQQAQSGEQTSVNPASNITYTALTKYSWQDETRKVKIYFSLENVGNQCPANQVEIQFKQNSVQLRLRNYRKQNLIFSIKHLFGEIIPQQSKYLMKTNTISITLAKKSTGTWSQLHYKQDKFKTDKKEDMSDPNASIMNMMKKMYEQGDDTMKKTIAQAWTKSRENKGKDDGFKFD